MDVAPIQVTPPLLALGAHDPVNADSHLEEHPCPVDQVNYNCLGARNIRFNSHSIHIYDP
jgi:hypothetical protein